jgi:hypothetical protein
MISINVVQYQRLDGYKAAESGIEHRTHEQE